jgi:hypothetical protein
MFGKLSLALLIVASPAFAQDTPAEPAGNATAAEPPVAYKTKKICRAIEVVGSSIPRMACSTKRVPIKPAEPEESAEPGQPPQAEAPQND